MPKTLQFRRGTTCELSTEAGTEGELFVDTTKKTVVVMDGGTCGGYPLVPKNTCQVAIGQCAGLNPSISTVAVGYSAGKTCQGGNAVAVGSYAGESTQSCQTVAVGNAAGQYCQGGSAVAIGDFAGNSSQGTSSVAIGPASGTCNQGEYSVAIGACAGKNNQACFGIAIGYSAGYGSQGESAIAIGKCAAVGCQAANSIKIDATGSGFNTPTTSGFFVDPIRCAVASCVTTAVGLGYCATSKEIVYGVGGGAASPTVRGTLYGFSDQCGPTSVGYAAGEVCQGGVAVAIGACAGQCTQGSSAIAIGYEAGKNNQAQNAIAIGRQAAFGGGGCGSIAIGYSAAGCGCQFDGAIAIGVTAAANGCQCQNAIAIGFAAGVSGQGCNAIAIGGFSTCCFQAGNSIIINASGTGIATGASGFFVAPVRSCCCAATFSPVYYNPATKEFII
jgi:hypothetical protein